MTINPPLILVSALFFLALALVAYLGSWLTVTVILSLGRRCFSHGHARHLLMASLVLPPLLAALPTVGGATMLHSHAAPALEHHSAACIQLFTPLLADGRALLPDEIAFTTIHALAWLLLFVGIGLVLRLIHATAQLERGLTPYLRPPSPRLEAALARVGTGPVNSSADRFFECAIPVHCSSVLGVLRPRVVLSQELIASFTEQELDAVVAHEAGHLRCRDVFGTFVVGALGCLFFFFQPVTLLVRRWREETELACDQAAVATTRQPLALAAAVLRASGVPAAGALGNGRSHLTASLGFTDAAACCPAKRVEILIAQAENVMPSARRPSPRLSIFTWFATLGLTGASILLLLSRQIVCFTHCSLETLAHLLP